MNASDIPFERPCPYEVCKLEFDAKGRCTACGLKVVDLSAGTEDQARSFLADGARSCVAYAVGVSGRILFGRAALTAGLVAAAGGAFALSNRVEPVSGPGCEQPETSFVYAETLDGEGAEGETQADPGILGRTGTETEGGGVIPELDGPDEPVWRQEVRTIAVPPAPEPIHRVLAGAPRPMPMPDRVRKPG